MVEIIHDKLVRDNIITLIRQNGQKPEYYIADTEEYNERLFDWNSTSLSINYNIIFVFKLFFNI